MINSTIAKTIQGFLFGTREKQRCVSEFALQRSNISHSSKNAYTLIILKRL